MGRVHDLRAGEGGLSAEQFFWRANPKKRGSPEIRFEDETFSGGQPPDLEVDG